ncbi:hypothetical protein EDD80_1188 [Anseongella ginsenosidimutans]|uniref:Uncharacterized protein n=2 Tax=Anseongella ginsenosidimutans TaxID=496056 RepID=A0A4R3KM16_9SPHI|nr:hypothetical protein EDD80_1188 [Anseongella ginsenosidimutans]
MTVQEIHKELFEDVKNLRNKLDYYHKEFRKQVLKASRYPFTRSYDCKTKGKKNLFVATFTAMKRSDWESPILDVYGIYARPEGSYAAPLTIDQNMISIYPPHFFKRYRERIVKDETISTTDLIRCYFKNDWGFMGAVVNEDFESVYHCFEDDDKVSFVAASSEGYCFGERQGNIHIVKTIISEDMLFENQKPLFSKLKQAFIEANKERYGWK